MNNTAPHQLCQVDCVLFIHCKGFFVFKGIFVCFCLQNPEASDRLIVLLVCTPHGSTIITTGWLFLLFIFSCFAVIVLSHGVTAAVAVAASVDKHHSISHQCNINLTMPEAASSPHIDFFLPCWLIVNMCHIFLDTRVGGRAGTMPHNTHPSTMLTCSVHCTHLPDARGGGGTTKEVVTQCHMTSPINNVDMHVYNNTMHRRLTLCQKPVDCFCLFFIGKSFQNSFNYFWLFAFWKSFWNSFWKNLYFMCYHLERMYLVRRPTQETFTHTHIHHLVGCCRVGSKGWAIVKPVDWLIHKEIAHYQQWHHLQVTKWWCHQAHQWQGILQDLVTDEVTSGSLQPGQVRPGNRL